MKQALFQCVENLYIVVWWPVRKIGILATGQYAYPFREMGSFIKRVQHSYRHRHITTHYSPVSTGTRQHLVDTNNVEWVQANTQMESILAARLHQVFVGTYAPSFQRLRRNLLKFIRHQVDTQWQVVHFRLLSSKIKDSNLWI